MSYFFIFYFFLFLGLKSSKTQKNDLKITKKNMGGPKNYASGCARHPAYFISVVKIYASTKKPGGTCGQLWAKSENIFLCDGSASRFSTFGQI
jgi:hypothetical protein